MKKLIFSVLAVVSLQFTVAQSSVTVPTATTSAFSASKGSSVVATWSESTEFYIANYTADGHNYVAFFSKTEPAILVKTDKEVEFTELSAPAQAEITNRFGLNNPQYVYKKSFITEDHATFKECVLMQMADGKYIRFYFDAAHKMVKREL